MAFKLLRKNFSDSSSCRGQVTVEVILMTVLLVVIWLVFSKTVKDGGYMDDFVVGPNKLIGNMIANGNWMKDSKDSKDEHPNRYGRRWSWSPE